MPMSPEQSTDTLETAVQPSAASSSSTLSQVYDSFGMNPRTLRFFLLEKGLDVPRREMDILAAENREPAYLKLNPAGQLPALQLPGGAFFHKTPALWGASGG